MESCIKYHGSSKIVHTICFIKVNFNKTYGILILKELGEGAMEKKKHKLKFKLINFIGLLVIIVPIIINKRIEFPYWIDILSAIIGGIIILISFILEAREN